MNNLLKTIDEEIDDMLNLDRYSIDDNWYLYKDGVRQYSSTSKSDLINYLKRTKPELLNKFNLNNLKPSKNIITLYRGIGYNTGNNYYSPSKEFAMEFTRTGRESEIITRKVDSNRIYKHNPLPRGYGEEDPNFDLAINIAKKMGLNAIWVDEGFNQPSSVFIINPNEKV